VGEEGVGSKDEKPMTSEMGEKVKWVILNFVT
jgi:hypothetical protein